ncbi:MAG: HAMP domain-containing sensor histidine kinase, partial [Acidimicrobiales bacterium]
LRPKSGIREIDTVRATLTAASGHLNGLLARERAFSADLAHQLRTPVASLRLRLETEQVQRDHDHELIEGTLRDVDRLERTIEDLITLARDATPATEPRPLASLVGDAERRWEAPFADAGRALRVTLEPELPFVVARSEAVRQILDVLLDNAVVHGAGTATLTANRVGYGAVVAIADEGTTPIDPVEIFERRTGSGSGIGLALARRLADAEGLRLLVDHVGPGVTFHLIFGGLPQGSSTRPPA